MNIKIFKQFLVVIFLIAFFIYFAYPSLDPLVPFVVYEYTSKVNREKYTKEKMRRIQLEKDVESLTKQIKILEGEPDSSHLNIDDVTDTPAALGLLQAQVVSAQGKLANKIKNMKKEIETQLKTRIDDLELDLDNLEGVVYDDTTGVDAIYAELGTIGTTVGVISNNVNNDTTGLGAIYSDLGTLITTVGDISSNVYHGTSGLDAIYSDLGTLITTVGDGTSGLVYDVNALETTVGDGTDGLVEDVVDISNQLESLISNYNRMFDDISTNISDISAILVTDVSYVPTDVQAWLETNYVTYHDDSAHYHSD
tara:strand:- start:1897 stop:2826 length:930 start_codon:yes stop_codon:yes gene_type:complete